jgi:replicative DNA helicase
MAKLKTEDIPIEHSILYSVFKYGHESMRRLLKIIDVETFSNKIHQAIFKNIKENYNISGNVLSINAIYNLLSSSDQLNDEEKPALKSILDSIKTSAIKLDDVEVLSKELRQYYVTRKMYKLFTQKTINTTENLDTILYEVERGVVDLRKALNNDLAKNVGSLKGQIAEREQYMFDVKNNPVAQGKVKTGIANFDKYITGLGPGMFAIFLAKSGDGKSMMLMRTAIENFKVGIKTIIITIEMNHIEYLQRLDSNISGINHDKFSSGNILDKQDEVIAWKNSITAVGNATDDLLVYYVPENCTPATVDLIIENAPFKPQLVIVDYAGDMSSGNKKLSNYEFQAQSEIFKSLKELAGKHACTIFTAQQVRRGVKSIDKESGSLTKVATERADMLVSYEVDEEGTFEANGEISTRRYLAKMVKYRHGRGLQTYFIELFHKMTIYEMFQDKPMYANVGYLNDKDKKSKQDDSQEEKSNDNEQKTVSSSEPSDNEMEASLDAVMD